MILLVCPDFPGDDRFVLPTMLRLKERNFGMYRRIFKRLLSSAQPLRRTMACYKPTSISEEVISQGFRPFAKYPEDVKLEPQEAIDFRLNESDGTFVSEPPIKRIRRLTNYMMDNPCVEWFSKNVNELLVISAVLRPFSSVSVCKGYTHLFPDLQSAYCFAILGLHVSDQPPAEDSENVISGTILIQSHKSPTFNFDSCVKKVTYLLGNNLGLSQEDIFRNGEFVRNTSRKTCYMREPNTGQLRKFNQISQEENDNIDAMYKKMTTRGDRVKIVSLHETAGAKPLKISVQEDFDLSQVNCVAALVGTQHNDLKLREILTEDMMQSLNDNDPSMATPTKSCVNFTFKRMSKVFFDLIMFFAECKMNEIYPHLKEGYDACYKAMEDKAYRDIAVEREKNSRMCPHCGKFENEFIVDYNVHKKRCMLEHQGCDCNLIFKTPSEKRRHMKLYHSGNQYLECNQCSFVTPRPHSLQNHINTVHGIPGHEEMCDLCNKSFKSINHLRIHRFNHECYFCIACCLEIKGRNAHITHNMKVHNVGFSCDVCDKKFYTERELEVHLKVSHTEVWKS